MGLFDDDEAGWGQPVESTGDFAKPEILQNHLLIVLPVGYVAHSLTRFSQPGKKSDALVCDIIDLDAPDDAGNPGKIYRATWLRQAQLIVGLRPFVGKKVLGFIGKGMPKNGMNPPWVFTDMSTNDAATQRARAWAAAHRDFAVSPFQEPVAPAPAPVPQFQQPQQNQWQPPQQSYGPAQQPQFQQPDPWQQPAPQPQPFQPQYQQPAPQYPQQFAAPQSQTLTFPQPPQGTQIYVQQPQQQIPRFPVPQQPGAPTDMDMLAQMRAMRDRQQSSGTGPQPDMPPF